MYQCPNCQSRKIMPLAKPGGVRPDVPKSLIILVPGILFLLLFVAISLAFLVMGKTMPLLLQLATIIAFLVTVVSAILFWRAMPRFKQSLQHFMQHQKHWQCRDCGHCWENP